MTKKILIVKGKVFTGQSVRLDNHSYEDCTFKSCNLLIDGSGSIELVNNNIIDCQFTFDGNAGNALHFLSSLYSTGIPFLVNLAEGTIQNIRDGKY